MIRPRNSEPDMRDLKKQTKKQKTNYFIACFESKQCILFRVFIVARYLQLGKKNYVNYFQICPVPFLTRLQLLVTVLCPEL